LQLKTWVRDQRALGALRSFSKKKVVRISKKKRIFYEEVRA
jgi:hypothetical protein